MKKITLVLMVFMLTFASVQDVAAQAFWKKLGKIAEKVLDATSTSSNTSNNSSSSLSTNSSSSKKSSTTSTTKKDEFLVTMPGISARVIGCSRYGTGVKVTFVLDNKSSQDYVIKLGDVGIEADGVGERHTISSKAERCLGIDYQYSENSGAVTAAPLLSNSSMQGYAYFENVETTSLTWVGFRLFYDRNSYDKDNEDCLKPDAYQNFSFKERYAVKPFANTNPNSNIVFSANPDLYVDYLSMSRVSTEMRVKAIFKGIGLLPTDLPNFTWTAYSEDGDSYYCDHDYYSDLACTKRRFGDKINPGEKCYCIIKIKKVPTTVRSFSILRGEYHKMGDPTFPVEFRSFKLK